MNNMKFLKNFSIFQKLLIAPGVTLIFFVIFFIFTYVQHQAAQESLSKIKEQVQPMLSRANENIVLFDAIHKIFTDAVSAKELEWIKNTVALKNELDKNLKQLENSSLPLNVQLLQDDFELFYTSAKMVSKILVQSEDISLDDNVERITKMVQFRQDVQKEFKNYRDKLQINFDNALLDTNNHLDNILFFGLLIGR